MNLLRRDSDSPKAGGTFVGVGQGNSVRIVVRGAGNDHCTSELGMRLRQCLKDSRERRPTNKDDFVALGNTRGNGGAHEKVRGVAIFPCSELARSGCTVLNLLLNGPHRCRLQWQCLGIQCALTAINIA